MLPSSSLLSIGGYAQFSATHYLDSELLDIKLVAKVASVKLFVKKLDIEYLECQIVGMDTQSDTVDQLLDDWTRERPDLDASGLGITSRISLLSKVLAREDQRALAPLGLASWACDVLLALRRQGPPYQLTPTDLRRLTLLTSGAMTTRLDRLEEAGLVQRNPHSGDRRSLQVSLTEQGHQLANRALGARLGMVERLLAPLTPDESQAAAEALRKLLAESRPE